MVRLRLDRNLAVLRLRNLYDEDSDNDDEGQETTTATASTSKKIAKGGSNAMVTPLISHLLYDPLADPPRLPPLIYNYTR